MVRKQREVNKVNKPSVQYYSDAETGEDRFKFDFVYPEGTVMAWYERVGEEWQMMMELPCSEVLNELNVSPF